jgi:acyl carrier protein
MSASVEQRVREIVAEKLGVGLSIVTEGTLPARDYHSSKFMFHDITFAIADEFGTPQNDLNDCVTVGDLVRCVEAAMVDRRDGCRRCDAQSMVEEARGPVEAERVREATRVGRRVQYTYPGNGWDRDIESAWKRLTPGAIYTVSRVEVHDWHTRLWFEETGDEVWFNSVQFTEAQP